MSELQKRILTGVILSLSGVWLILFAPTNVFYLVLSFVFGLMVWELLRLIRSLSFVKKLFVVFLYIGLPMLSLAYIGGANKLALLWLIFCIAATDIGAYAFGKNFGKSKIAPSISPHKSWEGLAGGIFCATLIGYNLYVQTQMDFLEVSPFWLVVIIPLISILAQTGDFFESFLKRRAGVKDSSNLLPGHGGLLDRFDGLLFVAPFMAFLILF